MSRFKFKKLFNVVENRIKEDGKKSPQWFLGFMEGLGSRSLTGSQIGALIDLCLIPDKDDFQDTLVSPPGEQISSFLDALS